MITFADRQACWFMLDLVQQEIDERKRPDIHSIAKWLSDNTSLTLSEARQGLESWTIKGELKW